MNEFGWTIARSIMVSMRVAFTLTPTLSAPAAQECIPSRAGNGVVLRSNGAAHEHDNFDALEMVAAASLASRPKVLALRKPSTLYAIGLRNKLDEAWYALCFNPRSTMSPVVEVRGSVDELYLLLCETYAQTRAAAKRLMRQERVAHTLQPTALVHEAFLRLIGQKLDVILDSKNFVGLAVRVMEQILVDYSRKVHAEKRGNGLTRVPLEKADRPTQEFSDEFLALRQCLEQLEKVDPQASRVVRLRYIAGFTADEAGAALGVSRSTVEESWHFARLWLFGRLTEKRGTNSNRSRV